MRNKNWIKHVGTLLVLLCFGLLAAGSLDNSGSSESYNKKYSDFDTYYLTTTQSIALGDVESGTPVWFWGRVNAYSDGSIISMHDSESKYRLQKANIYNAYDFQKAFATQPDSKYMKIYGYIVQGDKLRILRVEHSGHYWVKN